MVNWVALGHTITHKKTHKFCLVKKREYIPLKLLITNFLGVLDLFIAEPRDCSTLLCIEELFSDVGDEGSNKDIGLEILLLIVNVLIFL